VEGRWLANIYRSPTKFTNKDEPARWPSGASSQPNGRSGLGVLRHPHTTWGYSDKAFRTAMTRPSALHEGSDGSSKFIFDLMEPERPKIDRAILDFIKGHVFDPDDFVIRSDGVCRLNPEMARMVVAKVSA
jgi:CRISPR associated protein Cas1